MNVVYIIIYFVNRILMTKSRLSKMTYCMLQLRLMKYHKYQPKLLWPKELQNHS